MKINLYPIGFELVIGEKHYKCTSHVQNLSVFVNKDQVGNPAPDDHITRDKSFDDQLKIAIGS